MQKNKIFIVLIVFIGILFINIDRLEETYVKIVDNKNIELFFSNEKSPYKVIIEIPKINLKKGIYDKTSPNNNIDKNIVILGKDMPGIKNNFILAGHSGNSIVSYFENLKYLDIKDTVYIYYEHHKYIYNIKKIYDIEKKDTIQFKIKDEGEITLITCKPDSEDLQTIYVANLSNIMKYY